MQLQLWNYTVFSGREYPNPTTDNLSYILTHPCKDYPQPYMPVVPDDIVSNIYPVSAKPTYKL